MKLPAPRFRIAMAALALVTALLAGGVYLLAHTEAPERARPIAGVATAASLFIGAAVTARPLVGERPASHPFLADAGRASMHADGASSDTHPGPGVLGIAPSVRSRAGGGAFGASCPLHVFDRHGLMIAMCANVFGSQFVLIDPVSLDILARFSLPPRPSTFHALITLDPGKIFGDTSGAYFYLDHEDQILVADSQYRVRRLAHEQDSHGNWSFRETAQWDLSSVIPHDCPRLLNWAPDGECDKLTALLPDTQGRIWFVSRNGRVGTLNPMSGVVRATHLPGEEIQNGFSAAADGVFIASDHAMYRFSANEDGAPEIGWREQYDRGSSRKVGSINQGSGTTPTLLGSGYVVFTDNADEKINLMVLRRAQDISGERLVCRIPLFQVNGSAAENSPIVWGNSIIVENNSGYRNAVQQHDWGHIPGGMTRIDLRSDGSGCDVVWTAPIRAPSSVAKLSAASGLVYAYEMRPQPNGEVAWYLAALDFHTGEHVFSVLVGAGRGFDNNWSAVTLGPDGTIYVGLFGGLAAVRDQR